MMTGVDRSGTWRSIRLSRFPRGMWTAPGMYPCSYSSRSRTSRIAGAGFAREARGRLGRRLLADLPLHGSQMIAVRLLHLTYPFPVPSVLCMVPSEWIQTRPPVSH